MGGGCTYWGRKTFFRLSTVMRSWSSRNTEENMDEEEAEGPDDQLMKINQRC